MSDQEFIEYLSKRFDIPLKRLQDLVVIVRTCVNATPAPGSPHRDKNKDFARIVEAPVQVVHIETREGVIHLSSKDHLFQYFNRAITLLRGNFIKEMNGEDKKWQKQMNDMAERSIFRFFDVFRTKGMTAVDRDAAIGRCLCHFRIYARTPILTEAEWDENRRSADTYHDYLHQIVKSRRKKFK
ncbi:MAG: hypothetical protein IH593_14825 [Bacteroidales bacterium]|nr:hypothetical protein [Bacteroidales bacterium]